MRNLSLCLLALSGVLAPTGCAPATGELTVILQAEESIPGGLSPGDDDESVVDGWRVDFERYVIAIGDVRVGRSSGDLEAREPTVRVVDLAGLPARGVELARFTDLEVGRWDVFGYRTPTAEGAVRDDSVTQADLDAMVAAGWTYLLEGTLTKADGQSCPGGECRDAPSIAFRIGAASATTFGPCEAEEGLPGATITEDGTTVSVTIHGDHIFFDAFPSGAETIARRAQWLADADLDGDDAVTVEEVREAAAADLFPSSVYSLTGAPIPIETGEDFVRSQLATQGHFQGEGECPWMLEAD